MGLRFAAALLYALIVACTAVKRQDFKTCDQSGFCKRTRALADRATVAGAGWKNPYSLVQPSFSAGVLSAGVENSLFPNIQFSLQVRFQSDGVARIVMDEVNGLRQRYNETGSWTVQVEPVIERDDSSFVVELGKDTSSIVYAQGRHELQLQHSPLVMTFYRDGQPHIVLNERGLLNMEHFRTKSVGESEPLVIQDGDASEKLVPDDAVSNFLSASDEEGMWEETFSGARDTKPKGESFSWKPIVIPTATD